jgi:hypothetical protein
LLRHRPFGVDEEQEASQRFARCRRRAFAESPYRGDRRIVAAAPRTALRWASSSVKRAAGRYDTPCSRCSFVHNARGAAWHGACSFGGGDEMNRDQIRELVLQAIETERAGQKVYEAALDCARDPALREVWQQFRRETEQHERIMVRLCAALDLDPEDESPGRAVARLIGECLVEAIRRAAGTARPETAQVAAAECVLLAETKDHLHWQLIGRCAEHAEGETKRALQSAYEAVEPEERRHLRGTEVWARELWLHSLELGESEPPSP